MMFDDWQYIKQFMFNLIDRYIKYKTPYWERLFISLVCEVKTSYIYV